MKDVRRYRKGDTERVSDLVEHGDHLVTIDPGADGLALLFPPVDTWSTEVSASHVQRRVPPAPIHHAPVRGFELYEIATMRLQGVTGGLMVVIEDSFGGGRANAQTDIVLAHFAGACVGALSMLFGVRAKTAWVLPASWITACGTLPARAKRAQRKALANRHVDAALGPDHRAAFDRADQRQAFADAYGIATWWGQVATTPLLVRPGATT